MSYSADASPGINNKTPSILNGGGELLTFML